MTLDALIQLLVLHKWLAASAAVIGLCVRLLKSDSPVMPVPAAYRAWLALGLGAVSGVLDQIVNGTPVLQAVLGGLGSAMIAITGHETLIEGLRKGKEFGVKKDSGPSAPTGPTGTAPALVAEKKDAPAAMMLAFAALLSMLAMLCPGCKDTLLANNVEQGALTLEQTACVIAQAELGVNESEAIRAACDVAPSLTKAIADLLKARQQGMALAEQKLVGRHREHCSYDAGADAGADAAIVDAALVALDAALEATAADASDAAFDAAFDAAYAHALSHTHFQDAGKDAHK